MLAMATILRPGIGVLCVLAAWRENMIFMLTENAIAKEIVDAAYRVHTTPWAQACWSLCTMRCWLSS